MFGKVSFGSALLLALLAWCAASPAQAGTFSTTNFTGDADSGISSAKTYTHAYDVSGAGVVINGVTFTGTAGGNPSNATFTTSELPDTFSGALIVAAGSIGTLTGNFNYRGGTFAGSETVNIYGLTPGNTYTTRFYTSPFGGVGGRVQTVTSNADSTSYDGNVGPRSLNYTFQAIGHANSVSFNADDNTASFHNYGFSNEVTALAAPFGAGNATRFATDLFNTGVNSLGAPLADGTADPHYAFISGPQVPGTNPQATVQANHPAWSANGPESEWIGVTGNGANNVASGTYEYRTTFTLPSGTLPGTAQVSGLWWADNDGTGLEILLNGVSTGVNTTAPFNSATGTLFTLTNGMGGASFLQGLNTLTFRVPNPGGANPGGLRIGNLQASAQTPEPASIAVWSILGLAGAAYGWRTLASRGPRSGAVKSNVR